MSESGADKAGSELSESKVLRVWTYIICGLFITGLGVWQLAPILTSVAKLIEIMK